MSGDLPDDFSSAAFRRYWGDDAAGRAEELARQWTHEVMSYNLAIAVVLKKAIDSVTNFGPPRYFTAKGYDYTEIVSSITDMIPDT
ncbi:MAG: hypothetical protein KGL35_28490, partial [Bradyrhizobium sp.]|nr:hypothetical protein [Bradyrhizobium sp.]